MRTIRVSTHDLLFALTSRMPDTSHYLDTETGEVIPVFGFNRDRILAMVKAEPARYLRIAPQSGGQGFEMMKRFCRSVTRSELRRRLEAALGEENAFRKFRQTVKEVPSEHRRWQKFRVETMAQGLRARLREKAIELELIPDDAAPAGPPAD